MTPFQLKRSAAGLLLLGLGACCHGTQIVYTDWLNDPTGNTQVRACVDDTTARPGTGATDSTGSVMLAELSTAGFATETFLRTHMESADMVAPFERDASRGAIVVTLR